MSEPQQYPDRGKMGLYRALAQLTYQAYRKKDDHMAAMLARILERSWCQGERDLHSQAPETWTSIDRSMLDFTRPLTSFGEKGRNDRTKEKASYEIYLKALECAD